MVVVSIGPRCAQRSRCGSTPVGQSRRFLHAGNLGSTNSRWRFPRSLGELTLEKISKDLDRTKQGLVGAGIEKYKRKPDAAGLWPAHEDGVAD